MLSDGIACPSVFAMFEEFSRGYYLGQLYVEPYDGDRAVMHRDHHNRANQRVYGTGNEVDRVDAPLVMKVDGRHFPVHSATDVAGGTLALPDALLEATRVTAPPTLREVLLAKADKAVQLLRWIGVGPSDPAGGASS